MTFTACLSFLAIALHLANGGYVYKTDYFTVPVDHFSFTNNDTFRMKYLINDTYWERENGPIFFYAGNEGAIEMFCENTGFMWEIAEEFRALIVFAEHRYYGVSMPYGNKSFDDISRVGYLTSQQALADYVDLITYLRHNGSYTDRAELYQTGDIYDTGVDGTPAPSAANPVIAFGGSYGGMLAAWFRIKYPAIIEGAIASSAPIWQFTGMTPCNAFYRVTSSVYTDTSVECGLTILASWKAIDNVTKTVDGKTWLSQKWNLCSPLTNDGDVSTLKQWVSELYVNLAMINYPYPANFLTPLPGNPVKEVCKPMKNHKEDEFTLLGSVFRGLSVYFNYTGTSQCLDILSSSAPTLGEKGWNYQSCTEMVMPMCSNGIKDIFEKKPWNFEENARYCYETFGVQPSIYTIEKTYGGKNLNAASNIIFSNGLLDPWSSGGVLQDISKTVIAVVIPESAHHLDLRASNAKDPESVIKARKLYKNWIKKWIFHYQKHPTRGSNNSFVKQQIVLTI
ncbi:PREDICTED: lysosomal Pro-X carboxypeptidase-like [Diuraphis noxia]|uniref:lysosomal Pro-X carboxypeptidase-like n=1 Tax=Diuraphis noxia TaxID=143948 RepID=UPI000763B27A|nr:PREDICTED: lysosomal Pro-X carboxypeptidase-like [Diuraphis noxia]